MGHSSPEILGLLGDPLRWSIVVELGRSDRRVGELVELVGKPQNLVSYHLAELRRAGLVTGRRSSADGRDVYYRADVRRCRELLDEAGQALRPRPRRSGSGTDRIRRRERVLFVCTGNSARSQIAEALTRHRSEGAVEAVSAGSHPKPLHPNAVRVMAARGIDIAGHPTTPLTRVSGRRFDRVLTLCDKVREVCPEFPGSPITAHWSIADPAAGGGSDTSTYPAFELVTDEIDDRVEQLLDDLRSRPPERTNHG